MFSPTNEAAVAAILAEMERQGVTQVDLARDANVPRATLQRRLAGSPFSIDELERVAQALGVEVSELVKGAAA